jgi:DNA repair ATPase RecN
MLFVLPIWVIQAQLLGHQHLRVQKSQDKEGAQTTVTQLSNNQRVDEIEK